MTKKTIMKIDLKKIAVSFVAVVLITSFCFPFSLFERNTAHAEDGPKAITTINGFPCAANEILIKFKDSSSKEAKANTLDSIDPEYKTLSTHNMVKVTIPEGTTLEDYLGSLNQNSDIEYAQPNYAYRMEMTVNDPFTHVDEVEYYQWFHDKINTFEAWDYTMGAGVTVAVLDTGAWISHEDLGANITLMPDIASNDDDGPPYDYSSVPQDDDYGHGTHVTGIIGATANNGLGGAGIAPQSDIVVFDVFEHYELLYYDEVLEEWVGSGVWDTTAFTDDIIAGIEAAVSYGADIINISLGGYYTDTASENAVNYATASGTIVVCSAGNGTEETEFLGVSDGPPDNMFHSPSDYDASISVISTDYFDDKAPSSSYGPRKDISAPGEGVASTIKDGSYDTWGGTSMAAPMVAGVCALILSADPSLTVDEVKEILYKTANDLGVQSDYDATYDEYRNDTYAFGLVNAHAAVLAALDKVYKVELDHENLDVGVGKTGTLNATVYPSDASNQNLTWSSDNEAAATVENGVITGHSVGTATITVTTEDGGYTDTCDVSVYIPVTGVTLNKETTEIVKGETDTLVATVTPENAANKNVTWSSDNPTAATVENGVITAQLVGTATITVTTEDGSYTDECYVEVVPVPVTGVSLDKSSIVLGVGGSDTLTETVVPENAGNKNVTWTSDNELVATVTDGVVTGEAEGTTTITVTTEDGSFEATCDVTVNVEVTGVTLNKETAEIIIGESDTLIATVAPADATNKNVTWTSSDEAVATVEGGVVTSVSVGTAKITVVTEDGGYPAECIVSVIPIPADGVTLNKNSSSLYEGASEMLDATVSPDTAANKNVTWTSSNYSIVDVDSEGLITAVSAGDATITVTTESGSHTDVCSVNVDSLTPVTIDDTIKVKLSINDPTYLYFFIDGNYSVLGGSGQALERQQYNIRINGSTLELYYGSSSSSPIYTGSTITLTQHAATSGNNFVWIDNYAHGPVGYLGNIVFSISGGAIQAVNHVYLEEYLYGVVPNEMSDSWPAEALKAQAVAARSYAASSMGGGAYDVVDTSSSQVYKGYDDGDVNTIAAVNATQKKVLQYGTTIKKTYFAASNGGYTDSPYHVWPGGDNMPYAIYEDPYDVANPSSPYEKIFFPVAIDGSHPITTADNVDGTPNIANAVAYIKSRILASGQLSGYGVTTVNDFELTGVLDLVPHTYDTDDGENHSINLPDGTNDCVDFVGATGRFSVSVGASGYEVSSIGLDLHYFDASNGITTYQVFNMSSLRLFVIEYEDGANPGWAIYQRRYGHGVGLSQRGAQQRANDGQTYDYMLSFYYPYTSLVDLSYAKDALTSKVPVDNSNAVVVCNDYLNVRAGPSTGYGIVGTLPAGARIQVTATGDWHTINYGGVSCYVSSAYVNLDGYVAVTGVSLDTSGITLDKGATQTLVATIAPSNATNKSVTWSSNNQAVATVNQSGLVTAVGGGNAIITVTTVDGGRTSTCSVEVQVDVTGVTLNESSIVVYMGKTRTLTATVAPSDATDKSVTWSSDSEGIATVDGGVITPVSEGTTVIRVTTTDGGYTAFCNVTVGVPPTDAIYSSVYTVDQTDELLLGVPDEITIADMVANLDNDPDDIVVLGLDDMQITDWTKFAGTGMTVQLIVGSVVDELDVVVLGDINGDGRISITDYTMVRLDILDLKKLENAFSVAGDINKDSFITITDYTLIRLDILDLNKIN